MNNIIRLTTAVAVSFAFYGTSFAMDGSTGNRLVADVNVTESGYVSILASGSAWNNPSTCTKSDKIWLIPTATTYKINIAQVLTAVASGQQMEAWVGGCLSWNGATYPKIKALHLKK